MMIIYIFIFYGIYKIVGVDRGYGIMIDEGIGMVYVYGNIVFFILWL